MAGRRTGQSLATELGTDWRLWRTNFGQHGVSRISKRMVLVPAKGSQYCRQLQPPVSPATQFGTARHGGSPDDGWSIGRRGSGSPRHALPARGQCAHGPAPADTAQSGSSASYRQNHEKEENGWRTGTAWRRAPCGTYTSAVWTMPRGPGPCGSRRPCGSDLAHKWQNQAL